MRLNRDVHDLHRTLAVVDVIDAVIEEAAPHLTPATVGRHDNSEVRGDVRTADKWTANRDTHAWRLAETLSGMTCDEVQVVRYQTGGFYRPHRDVIAGQDRKTTIVVQLSDPATYTGGVLVVDGTVQNRARGAVITFPAATHHEAQPVRTGERWVIVAWSVDTPVRSHPRRTGRPLIPDRPSKTRRQDD